MGWPGLSAKLYIVWTMLTAYQVAKLLNMSPEWVRKAAQRGDLPCYRFGRYSIRFRPDEIEAWVQQHHHVDRADRVDRRHGQATSSGVVPLTEDPADEGTAVAERRQNVGRQPSTSTWRQ